MACVAHSCTNPECNFEDFNNEVFMDCPLCGAICSSSWDEAPDQDYVWIEADDGEFGEDRYEDE